MSAKKRVYSLKQHNELGIALQEMRDRLCSVATDLGKAYPKGVANLAVRSCEQIDKLRCKLDDIVCKENPDHKDAIRVYYRGSKTVG